MAKVCLYVPIGGALDYFKFSTDMALSRAGMEVDFVVLGWNMTPEVREYCKQKNYPVYDLQQDKSKGFLDNLYTAWNAGYEIGFKRGADYVIPMGSDHCFYKDWVKNLVKYGAPNRIVNCKLIENGLCPSLHTTRYLGPTTHEEFNLKEFDELCSDICVDHLIKNKSEYSHRLDAMPMLVPKDVWQRFGPMRKDLNPQGITGDTDFFDRCEAGGVEITKSLGSISYHMGGAETKRNKDAATKPLAAKVETTATAPKATEVVIVPDSLGSLYEAVAWANIQIYDLENKKWYSRKSGTATDAEINKWDELSRSWNEKRSLYKRKVDELLAATVRSSAATSSQPSAPQGIPYQVLPISLMADMLSIECIKVFDLTNKGNAEGVALATARKEALKKQIDNALTHITQTGFYDLKGEARTF